MDRQAMASITAAWPCRWVAGVAHRGGGMGRRVLSWAGPVAQPGGAARRRRRASPPALRGCAVSLPSPVALHEIYGRQLEELLDKIIAGEVPAVIVDQATAERWLFRLAGALMRVQEQHRVDEHGRCSACRPVPVRWWRPWSKRSTCTVYSALGLFLRQPDRFLLAAVTGQAPVSVRRAP